MRPGADLSAVWSRWHLLPTGGRPILHLGQSVHWVTLWRPRFIGVWTLVPCPQDVPLSSLQLSPCCPRTSSSSQPTSHLHTLLHSRLPSRPHRLGESRACPGVGCGWRQPWLVALPRARTLPPPQQEAVASYTRVRWSSTLVSFRDLLGVTVCSLFGREASLPASLGVGQAPSPARCFCFWCKVRGRLFLHGHLEAIVGYEGPAFCLVSQEIGAQEREGQSWSHGAVCGPQRMTGVRLRVTDHRAHDGDVSDKVCVFREWHCEHRPWGVVPGAGEMQGCTRLWLVDRSLWKRSGARLLERNGFSVF